MSSRNKQKEIEDLVEKKELAPGVILYKELKKIENANTQSDVIGIFIFKVELTTMSIVDFEVYLDQSENIELENKIDGELKAISKILPFETKEVARVIIKNDWKLKSKFKLTMNVPDKSTQYQYIKNDIMNLHKQIKELPQKISLIPFEFLGKNEIENELIKLKVNKFIDLDFLPNDDAVINSKFDDSLKDYFDYVIHWRSPEDFITDNNEDILIFNSYNFHNMNSEKDLNDIHQGLLPDNHLVSALSALCEKYNLINRLFTFNDYSKYGFYLVKLCINGEWINIIIDDLFPCIPLSFPMVSKCESNQLWILILEKALAKVYDCYYNLTNINIADFLQILTGCPTMLMNIEDFLKIENKQQFIQRLKNYVIDNKYITVAISKSSEINEEDIANNNNNDNNDNLKNMYNEEDMLTIPNYGYSIIDIKEIDNVIMIILRKVWYDNSKEKLIKNYEDELLKEHPSIETEIAVDKLVLKYEDFLKEFSYFSVCYINNWDEVRIRGKFVQLKEQEINNLLLSSYSGKDKLMESSILNNLNVNDMQNLNITLSQWYYQVHIEKETNLIITLFQDDDKFKENDSRKQLMDISITVLKHDVNNDDIYHLQTLDFSYKSNIQTELSLKEGDYIILPRTTGCFFGHPFDKVNVSHVTNTPSNTNNNNSISNTNNNMLQIYNYETKQFNSIFINIVKDIFKSFDLLLIRKLRYNEFKEFWKCITNSNISYHSNYSNSNRNINNNNNNSNRMNDSSLSEDDFKNLILTKYQSYEDGLTEKGLVQFFEDNYLSEGGDERVRNWLYLLGYDDELYNLRSRYFMLTVHSNNPINIGIRDGLNSDLNNKVNKLILKSLGEEIKKKKDICAIQYQSKNNSIVTVGCVNNGNCAYRVSMTFNDSNCLIFSGGSNKVERIVQPKTFEFFLHFFAIINEKECNNVGFVLDYSPIN